MKVRELKRLIPSNSFLRRFSNRRCIKGVYYHVPKAFTYAPKKVKEIILSHGYAHKKKEYYGLISWRN